MENVEKHLMQDLPSTKGGKKESPRPIQPFQIDDVMKNFCNETQPEIDPLTFKEADYPLCQLTVLLEKEKKLIILMQWLVRYNLFYSQQKQIDKKPNYIWYSMHFLDLSQ